jgi:hypothetical protein
LSHRDDGAAATVASMGTSFTEYRGHGFWANDGLLGVWLAALADTVPDNAQPWLHEAQQHWLEQAGAGFTGCVDAAMDTLVATGQRAQAIFPLAEAASRHLASLADTTGYLPASWLNERHISGQTDWIFPQRPTRLCPASRGRRCRPAAR